jgi:hypothetical protein
MHGCDISGRSEDLTDGIRNPMDDYAGGILRRRIIMGDTGICRVLFSAFLVLVFCSAVILEQTVARGQSSDLQTTLKLLQDKMTSLDALYTTAYLTNDRGQIRQFQEVFEITYFNADAGTCHISYDLTNPNSADTEFAFDLKDVGTVEAMTREQMIREVAAKSGHHTTGTTDPPEFVVDVILTNSNQDFMFHFVDQDLANSVAVALTRAVKLCGGHIEQSSASANAGQSAQDALVSNDGRTPNISVYNTTNQPRQNSQGPQHVQPVQQCTRTQYENRGATLWISNSCNIAVTVEFTSDSGNTWGQVDVNPNSRTAASVFGMGYNPQKDGTVYLFSCPKGSQIALPNGNFFLPRNYKGQFNCVQP